MAVERTSQRGMGWGHTDGLVGQSITDLRDALEELAYLIRDAEAKVDRLGTRLDRDRDNLRTDTRRLLRAQAAKERARYRELGQTLLRLRQRASVTNADRHALIAELERGRAALADLLRSQRALTAALMVAADWQSPSFMHFVTHLLSMHLPLPQSESIAHWTHLPAEQTSGVVQVWVASQIGVSTHLSSVHAQRVSSHLQLVLYRSQYVWSPWLQKSM